MRYILLAVQSLNVMDKTFTTRSFIDKRVISSASIVKSICIVLWMRTRVLNMVARCQCLKLSLVNRANDML